jgi:hypothetical protein
MATCSICGSAMWDVQGRNIVPLPFQCGSKLYADGSIDRGSLCYERQIITLQKHITELKDTLEAIADIGGSLTGEDAKEMRDMASEAVKYIQRNNLTESL